MRGASPVTENNILTTLSQLFVLNQNIVMESDGLWDGGGGRGWEEGEGDKQFVHSIPFSPRKYC